jgi:hypothetical protein
MKTERQPMKRVSTENKIGRPVIYARWLRKETLF